MLIQYIHTTPPCSRYTKSNDCVLNMVRLTCVAKSALVIVVFLRHGSL
nr:MAG TPA: hypothetical protein [Caudoviricetes sp.]